MKPKLLSSVWRGEAAYFVIFNLTNVLNYVYLIFVGFFLGADSYGLFGALFGIVYLASALGNMVKMAVARHVATASAQNGGAITKQVVTAGLAWSAGFALVVGLILVPAVPLVADALDSPTAPVVWSCLAIAFSIWASAAYGVLQGMERFPSLGAALFVAAAVRIALGGVLVVSGAGVTGAMMGVVLGFAVSALFALVLCFRQAREPADGRAWTPVAAPRLGSLATVLVASIVVAAPTSLDVVVVRHVFSGQDAGVFTGIAVLGRVIIFASIAVPFTVLPKVAARTASGTDTGRLLVDSLAITGCLALAAAGAIVFAVDVLGWQLVGTDVSGAGAALHWYLAAMVLFSLTATVIYYQVGKADGHFVLLAGAPSVVLQGLLIVLIPASLTGVAQLVFVMNAALLVVGLFFATARVSATSPAKHGNTVAIRS
ncbi:MAG: oligosaccharide flippase family protein [Dehalococcoidia bacterium]